jgi:hypothetical protein
LGMRGCILSHNSSDIVHDFIALMRHFYHKLYNYGKKLFTDKYLDYFCFSASI